MELAETYDAHHHYQLHYQPRAELLEVQVNKRRLIVYQDVLPATYQAFIKSRSANKYYSQIISHHTKIELAFDHEPATKRLTTGRPQRLWGKIVYSMTYDAPTHLLQLTLHHIPRTRNPYLNKRAYILYLYANADSALADGLLLAPDPDEFYTQMIAPRPAMQVEVVHREKT
ncbi:KTSC domain-containing protein [Levilactobacillus fujinensis]|uniref:KTSC domain-containing protein n=1 Tax=Levilactobacillus fujinensis TaxID=2486024 RepID=A0ABW1TE97_9LACO|nr:KTSC domain-containing protein [Levilactobacillus fujinensis]